MNKFFFLLPSAILWGAIVDSWPYVYFQVLRWVTSTSAVYFAYQAYNAERKIWTGIFIVTTVLFNPFVPFYMSRDTWSVVDFVAILIFCVYGIMSFRKKKHNANPVDHPLTNSELSAIANAKKILNEMIDEIEEEAPHDLDFLRKVITTLLDKHPNTLLQSMKEENRTEEDIILTMIKNFSFKFLSESLEGCYIYRGVLSMKGQAILGAHNYANEVSFEEGYITRELMEEDDEIMREEIAKNG